MSVPTWRKSSRSGGTDNSDCIEVARLDAQIGVRDSKAPADGHLTISMATFGELLGRIRAGELEL